MIMNDKKYLHAWEDKFVFSVCCSMQDVERPKKNEKQEMENRLVVEVPRIVYADVSTTVHAIDRNE